MILKSKIRENYYYAEFEEKKFLFSSREIVKFAYLCNKVNEYCLRLACQI